MLNQKGRAEFQSGDASVLEDTYHDLLNQSRYQEALDYISSFGDLVLQLPWPENENEPEGPLPRWLFLFLHFQVLAGQAQSIPDELDALFGRGRFRLTTPVWVATAIANTISTFLQHEIISKTEAEELLGWAMEQGAKGIAVQLSALRIENGTATGLDESRLQRDVIPEASLRQDISYMTHTYVSQETRNRTLTLTKLTELMTYLRQHPNLIDHVNIANVQWYSLASGHTATLVSARNNFNDRETELRESFDPEQLANVIGNHAQIEAVLQSDRSRYEHYFEEAISLGNAEAAMVYAAMPSTKNQPLAMSIRSDLTQNHELTSAMLVEIRNSIAELEMINKVVTCSETDIDSLCLLRGAEQMLVSML